MTVHAVCAANTVITLDRGVVSKIPSFIQSAFSNPPFQSFLCLFLFYFNVSIELGKVRTNLSYSYVGNYLLPRQSRSLQPLIPGHGKHNRYHIRL